jgi:putative Holliday junction resolvase
MKYLGVDYGQKKIGIAISDDAGSIAFPRDIILLDNIGNKHILYIDNLCEKEGVKDIVIGKSVDYQNKDNSIEKHIDTFIDILNKENKYIIHRIDERMSTSLINAENRFHFQKKQNSKSFSKNAKSVRDNTKDDDAKVAALILQNFLDSKLKL